MKHLFKNRLLKFWAYYDFANSSYVLIFQSFLLPVFFVTILQNNFGYSNFSWGLANGISTFLGVILAIFGGQYADKNERIKVFKSLIIYTFLSIVVFSFSIAYAPAFCFYLFILSNTFFIATIAMSDSLLKFVSNDNNLNEYSGFAWGWGYIGGILCLIIVMALQKFTGEFSLPVFLSVALFYFIFSFKAIRGISNNSEKIEFNPQTSTENLIIIPFSLKLLLLIGYWLISESITVIILFYSIYASQELKLSTQTIGVTLLCVQLIGFFSTWYGGKLADKKGTTKILGFSILIWITIITLLITTNSYISLTIIVILTGLVIGNSQSLLRAQFTSFVEKYNIGFNFGLFALSTQAAVIIGPLLHGFLSDKFGSQKKPMILLIVFLIAGFGIVSIISKRIKKNILQQDLGKKMLDGNN
jgi:MFS transporter, UMF1 family